MTAPPPPTVATVAPPVPAPVPAETVSRSPVRTTGESATRDAVVEPPTTDTGTPGTAIAQLGDGGLLARLGSGLLLSASDLAARGIDLSQRPQPVPGVTLKRATYGDKKVRITGDLAIPAVAEGEVQVTVDEEGTARISGGARRKLDIPALGNPTVSVALDEGGFLSGAVEGLKIVPPGLGRLAPQVTSDLRISGGRLSGSGTASLAYPGLGSATMRFRFTEEGVFAGEGSVHLEPPLLPPVDAALTVDEERNVSAEATVDLTGQTSPLPGLVISGGSLTFGYHNGAPSAAVTGLAADYTGLASLRIERMVLDKATGFTGDGSLTRAVPLLEPVTGLVRVRPGGLSGRLTITGKDFPPGLPVTRGTITVDLQEDGAVGFRGTVGVELGPAGKGDLTAAYDQGRFSLGAEVDLTVPGLQPVHISVAYADGQISGRADVPIDSARLPGLTGNVTVEYAQDRWSGETTLAFSADDGKVSGSVTVTVAQTEDKKLQVGGSGTVTAQLMPKVAGTLTATILPEGGLDLSGAIRVTEPVELFPEKRLDKELFSHSQNIPLWAILVAVIRIRAGVRAGIGPGVFRDITVTGSYTLGAVEADPSFSVSGELYVPAFVEGYVAFGAGLGLDVVLGSLTGGIEGVATAGLYGAISVVPELSYADGDWGIDGTATLAAGARLKLGLNAWAEVEALWVTVWEEEWKLAEIVMPLGPDLALQAHLAYRFGRPAPPELEFTTSDIDAESLIQGAMPKDGPAPAGARQALENRAEWKGALREAKSAPVPPELAAEAQKSADPPKAPTKPPKKSPPTPPGPEAGQPAETQDPTKQPTPGNEPARSAAVDQAAKPDPSIPAPVPESQVPKPDAPRYPGPITLATLDEPPAPMPRTRQQEDEDLDAARRAVDVAGAQATDTDALDNYFPRIKARFGLSSLGYQGDFTRGFEIVGEINPSFRLRPAEPLSGTGLPGDLEGRKTEVKFWTRSISRKGGKPFPVGAKMVAKPLGPDHRLGTKPDAQEELMALLPSEYIRGHLLNEQLGGPGEVRNLFPITRSANATHEAEMERWVKKWINEDRYWVDYSVEVTGGEELQTASPTVSFVNSKLELRAAVLATDLSDLMEVKTTVTSEYEVKATSSEPIDPRHMEEIEKQFPSDLARKVDKEATVRVADRDAVDPVLPEQVEDDLTAKLAAKGGKRELVEEELVGYQEIGPQRVQVLFMAYDQVHPRPDRKDRTVVGLDPARKGDLTRVCNLWLAGLRTKP